MKKRHPLPSDPAARAEMLREFSGLWIAVSKDEIVAAAPSPDEVFAKIDHLGLSDAAISRVPEPRLGVAVGLG